MMHTGVPRWAGIRGVGMTVEQADIRQWRLLPAAFALAVCAAAAGFIVPRGIESHALLAIKDEPAAIAERALDGKFDAAIVNREIATALAAGDADLAQSFVDLAAARHVAIDPALVSKTKAVVIEAA